jgi:hypothetical protein
MECVAARVQPAVSLVRRKGTCLQERLEIKYSSAWQWEIE